MDKNVNDEDLARIREIIDIEAGGICYAVSNLYPLELKKILNILRKCTGNIILTGCGTSGMAARKIAHTFNCIGLSAFCLLPSEALHGGMGAIKDDDVVIFISKGGHSSELDMMMRAIRKKKNVTIVVTENRNSFLAQNCSQILTLKVEREPDRFNMLATASTLAVISIFDAIAILLSEKSNYTKQEFLLIHPGGDVGLRLLDQLSD